MPLKTFPWDLCKVLDTPEARAAYVEAALKGGHPRVIAAALRNVVDALGRLAPPVRAGVIPSTTGYQAANDLRLCSI